MTSESVDAGSMVRDALAGAVAGGLATVAMTALMEPGLPGLLDRRWRPGEFVPTQVVRWLRDVTGRRRPRRGSRGESVAAGVAHMGYGVGAGALYGVLQPRLAEALPSALPPAVAPAAARALSHPEAVGALYGLAVWAAGYQGWMPLAGVRPATTDHRPEQWPVPIANHLLFGTVLARLFDRAREAGLTGTRARRG